MENCKRTFIAIKINPGKTLLDLISEGKETLKNEKISWVDVHNFHLTLHFIGETSSAQVKQVVNLLQLATANKPVFVLNSGGTAFFGSHRQPKVLIINFEYNQQLEQLVNATAEGLTALGLPGNLKSFYPHLTLARVKQLQNLQLFHNLVNQYKNQYFQSTEVNEIIYYESILQPSGAVYKPIQIFKLK